MPDEADPDRAALRLLRTTAERAGVPAAPDCSHYVRPEAWQAFFTGKGDGADGQDINDRLKAVGIPNDNVYFASLLGTLTPVPEGSVGLQGDWVNEIHPSIGGYAKLGPVYSVAVPKGPATLLVANV